MFGQFEEEYYADGVLKFEGIYKDGKPNGYGRGYYETGSLKYEGTWTNGNYDGDGTLYDENGNIIYSGKWSNGHQLSVHNINNNIDSEKLKLYMDELNSLIGLMEVKKELNSLINFVKLQRLRKMKGLNIPVVSLHMVFTGNPGTGKTTVARLMSRILFELGYLSKGHLIETERSGMVAGYLGQTALKTEEIVKKAIGGVLFIDEAYTLSNDDEYGQEAINTLLKMMEDNRENLVVIVAGYPKLMENFISSNPGLLSRFNKYIKFCDYTEVELYQIFEYICSKNSYSIDKECKDVVIDYIEKVTKNKDEKFGNARTMRNIFEKSISFQANRIMSMESIPDELSVITKPDVVRCFKEKVDDCQAQVK